MPTREQPLTVTLDAELVRRASRLTSDINRTVESLLKSYVEAEEAKRTDQRAQIAQWIAASNASVQQHGSPADEHNPF